MAHSRTARLLSAANRHSLALAWSGCVLAVMPAAILGWDAVNGSLGANPLDRVLRTPGRWALILLLVALTATPLRHALAFAARHSGIRYGRRLADWNWLIRLRRPLGLASFFYALAHVVLYLSLDAGFSGAELADDLRNKPYIIAGLGAFLLLLPLAVTSTDAWMQRLKRNWKRLHLLVYPAAILAVLHFAWLSKSGARDFYAYALVLGLLLGYRVAARWLRVREPMDALGEEVPDERPAVFSPKDLAPAGKPGA
jgi:sulfoxide reductase heme-binding subunit YedZ